jgi:hypothetical protein
MGVADHEFTGPMVEAALFRSGGVKLESYVYGPATNPDPAAGFRSYKAQGKGVGHVYIHVEGAGSDLVGRNTGLLKKSRYADFTTAMGVIVEILKHPTARAALKRLDDNPGTQEWLNGSTAIPIAGDWYGYAPNETTKRKIVTASINMRSHGDALFISSSYPEQLVALPVPVVV